MMDIRSADPDVREPFGNLVLDGLGQGALLELLPTLKAVHLHRSQVLARRGKPLKRVVFPVTSIISIEERVPRARIEVMTIGNEGLVGYWLGMGSEPIDAEIVCVVPGLAYEVAARAFVTAIIHRPELSGVVAQMAHSTSSQLMRNVVCTTIHSLGQRCARTLIEVALRLGDVFTLTHEEVAAALAATRPSITREMHALASAGAIEYRRGVVRILDRPKLEAVACSCFHTLEARRQRLAGPNRLLGGSAGSASSTAGPAERPRTNDAAPEAPPRGRSTAPHGPRDRRPGRTSGATPIGR